MSATPKKTIFKKILAGSLIFYVFSGVSSVLNYAFYPVIARFVSTSQYGEIQFLVSMFTQLAVGFVVLNILAIVISAKITDPDRQRLALKSLNSVACGIILLVVLVGSTLLYGYQDSLGLNEQAAILALSASLLVNVPFTVAIGRLQGSNSFMLSGIVSALGALFKLVFSVLFVVLGFGVTGAVLGIGVGMAVTLGLIRLIGRKQRPATAHRQLRHPKKVLGELRFIRRQAFVAIIGITVITLLSTADSIVSRLFFIDYEAGQYAAVATIAKAILAATSPLMWLALPPAVAANKRQTLGFIGIAGIVSLGCCGILTLFPGFFISSLLGIDAGAFTSLLSLSSLSMAVCSVAFIFVSAGICFGALKTTLVSAISALLIYMAVFMALSPHINPITASLYAQSAGALCLCIGGIIALWPPRLLPKFLLRR